ncbi:phospholipase A2 inhibitor and Ly6/PLAUR domain-containing protein-like [Rana temporaria]|uniref:phospholipase A2 inhibitor and Ly6/PLAUR domain-containing protein-like n=1 Tax=Rana temporaria TaxID=8407 RepID=UPI001AADC5D0|nr:phospholipase A2 inhibitor and Ly6/PLAUR domain-containing protein-like [Rana temporaria]
MTARLQILGVLSALVASGYSLSCTRCSSSSDSCTGPNVTCPSGSVCGAQFKESQLLGFGASKTYVMSCTLQNQCDTRGSFSLAHNLTEKMATSCCETNGCTPTLPSLPGNSSGSNGLMCPSCMSNSTWCDTSDTMECKGDEKMCFLYSTKTSGHSSNVSHVMRGCATKSICNFSSQSSSGKEISTEVKFICTSGSTDLQKGFYLAAVICILFFKVIYLKY